MALLRFRNKKAPFYFFPLAFVCFPPPSCPSFLTLTMAVVPLPVAASKTAAIVRTPSAAAAAVASPLIVARALNAPPSSRREPPSLQGSDAEKLREGIATFYDESSQLWEDVW